MGKVLVVNMLIASLFMYKLQVLPMIPKDIVAKVEDAITKFIWNNKRAKLPLSTLYKEKHFGGLGLANLEKRQKSLAIQWINIACQNKFIANLAEYYLGPAYSINLIWQCNIKAQDASKTFESAGYWLEGLKAWSSVNYYWPQCYEDIINQIIWYNSEIKVNKHVIQLPQNCKRIIRIRDLLSPANGWLDYNNFLENTLILVTAALTIELYCQLSHHIGKH